MIRKVPFYNRLLQTVNSRGATVRPWHLRTALPSSDTSPRFAKSLPSPRMITPPPRLSRFPKCVLRFCRHTGHYCGIQVTEIVVKDSRGSRKRDDIVAKRAHPRNAELGNRDTFTIRYGGQSVHELEIMINVLWAHVCVSMGNTETEDVFTLSWKRLYERLKSPSSKSRRFLT